MEIFNIESEKFEEHEVELAKENTTWCECFSLQDIRTITDYNGGLLIMPFGNYAPVWIPGESRASVDYDQDGAGDAILRYQKKRGSHIQFNLY